MSCGSWSVSCKLRKACGPCSRVPRKRIANVDPAAGGIHPRTASTHARRLEIPHLRGAGPPTAPPPLLQLGEQHPSPEKAVQALRATLSAVVADVGVRSAVRTASQCPGLTQPLVRPPGLPPPEKKGSRRRPPAPPLRE